MELRSERSSVAIEVDHLVKAFRLYTERNQTLKTALLRRKRGVFEEFLAVNDVSFQVKKGSTFGIIGSNGSGKSTTLKVLAQILEPDGGRAVVHGRVSALLELGAGFHPELSGKENIFLNGAILGISRKNIVRNYDEILEFSGLERFIDNPVKTYSSGMYARLGFSVAVNVDPDVLLIDEVLAVGDESFQRRCSEKISALRDGGRTVVIVSHGLAGVQSLCDEAVWIEKGVLQAQGAPSEVIEAYVAALHPEPVIDDSGAVHLGDGTARVVSARCRHHTELAPATGEPAVVELVLNTKQALPGAVALIRFKRTDGALLASASTRGHAGIPQGDSSFLYEIPRLALLTGTYELSAEIVDAATGHVHDRVEHAGRFDVVSHGVPDLHEGFVDLGGRWLEG
jgi:ABC-2 type transport system ATP-binding protein